MKSTIQLRPTRPINLNQTRLGKETMINYHYENTSTREGNPAFKIDRTDPVLLVLHLEKLAPALIGLLWQKTQIDILIQGTAQLRFLLVLAF